MARPLKKVGTTGNVNGVEITEDNLVEVLAELKLKKEKALTTIGMKAEKYAKALCPVGTEESTGIKGYRGGTLRNSITFVVKNDEVWIGSNVHYAPYVELGTGPFFQPEPPWMENNAPRGSGIGHGYVKPRPYLRPAIADHIGEYINIMRNEMKG